MIRCGGEVKTGANGGITVTLLRLNTPAENQIATAFLNEINSFDPVLLGADPIPIKFRVRACKKRSNLLTTMLSLALSMR